MVRSLILMSVTSNMNIEKVIMWKGKKLSKEFIQVLYPCILAYYMNSSPILAAIVAVVNLNQIN